MFVSRTALEALRQARQPSAAGTVPSEIFQTLVFELREVRELVPVREWTAVVRRPPARRARRTRRAPAG